MHNKTYNLVYCAMFAVLLALCSWISVPTAVPFTMQTFAVFFTVLMLGGKRGTITVAVYLLLGAVGIPVFSNFGAGIGYLLGATGGYAVGFLLTALIMWALESFSSKNLYRKFFSMLLGLLACYAFGSFWYVYVYAGNGSAVTVSSVLSLCVLPFLIPDLCKIGLALTLSKRLKPLLPF